jgi:two-component system NarL family response regulator
MSIGVIIADDHAAIREGIKSVIARSGEIITITGEATNGMEVLDVAGRKPADIYLIDISMPLLNGLETTKKLLAKDPDAKVIIISMHEDGNFVESAFRSGARGYMSKEDAIEEVIFAIRAVFDGKFFLSPNISGLVIKGYLDSLDKAYQAPAPDGLSHREKEILSLFAEGLCAKEIAYQLNLSPSTVHSHRQNIMKKLDIHRPGDLTRYILQKSPHACKPRSE